MRAEYLDITADQIPVRKRYVFDGSSYILDFKYNDLYGFFTVEVFDSTGDDFLFSSKLVYGQNIFDSVMSPISSKLIPVNIRYLTGESDVTYITPETFGREIKLYTSIEE